MGRGEKAHQIVGKFPVLRVGIGTLEPARVWQLLEDLGCTMLGWDVEEGAEAGRADAPRRLSYAQVTPSLYDQVFRKCPDAIVTHLGQVARLREAHWGETLEPTINLPRSVE